MKHTKVISLALLTAFTAQSAFTVDVFAEATDSKTITFLGTADLHGRIYPWEYAIDTAQEVGLAKVATVINEQRELDPELILVDTGDTIESNMINLFNDDEIHPMIKGFNFLNYDSWTLGNHEFNFGLDVLGNAISDFEGVALSSNVVNTADNSYYVEPYTVVSSQGVDIALVGLTAPYVKQWEASTPEHYEGLDFLDCAVAAQNAMDEINANEDVDLVVGVFHIGYDGEGYDPNVADNALEVLEAVEGFDAAFLAHAHDKIGYPLISNSPSSLLPVFQFSLSTFFYFVFASFSIYSFLFSRSLSAVSSIDFFLFFLLVFSLSPFTFPIIDFSPFLVFISSLSASYVIDFPVSFSPCIFLFSLSSFFIPFSCIFPYPFLPFPSSIPPSLFPFLVFSFPLYHFPLSSSSFFSFSFSSSASSFGLVAVVVW